MTSQQAGAGLLELMLPDGGHVLADFGVDGTSHPDLEATVVQMMLCAVGNENVCKTPADYAEASGMSARFFLGRDTVIVAIVEPSPSEYPTSRPFELTARFGRGSRTFSKAQPGVAET